MDRRRRAIVPLSLGLALLGVVVAAGLSPNSGIVTASSNCTYGQCVSSQSFPLWAISASIAAVVIALLLALLLIRRRRRPGQPPSEWQGPGAGPGASTGPGGPGQPPVGGMAAAAAVTPTPEPTPSAEAPPVWHEGTSSAPEEVAPEAPPPPPPVPPSTPEYLEGPTPEEAPPAVVPAPEPAPLAPPAAKPAPEEAEPDIDSLMAELEKISGEILKQKPKKKNGPPAPSPTDDDAP